MESANLSTGKSKKHSNNQELVSGLTKELISSHELFHDTQKQPYIALNRSGSKVLGLDGKEFRSWLIAAMMDEDEYISSHIAEEVAERLRAYAIHKQKEPKPLVVRICRKDNIDGSPSELWYDLADADGMAVHITKDGYTIKEPPIIFRRYSHQHEQVKPQPRISGEWDDIFQLVNLKERDDKVAFTVFAVSCFIDRFPKPILLLRGTNGSGKSTPMRILHSLIDPSELGSGYPLARDNGELARIANKHAILHFDNIDGKEIKPDISDALCRITSGQAFVRRTLYSDDDDTIFKGQRPVMLNGIGKLAEREDLLDRCLIFNMKRIPQDKRMTEAKIFAKFNEMKPYLLHDIFTALSKVITIYPTVNIENIHRMADFEALGYAICEAVDGYSGEEWCEIYDRIVKRQVDSAFEESATAQLAKFLVDRSKYHIWEGTATDMLNFKLIDGDYEMQDADYNLKNAIEASPTFPKNAAALGVQLNRAESTLQSLGIIIEHSKGSQNNYKGGVRWITLKDHGWVKSRHNNLLDEPKNISLNFRKGEYYE